MADFLDQTEIPIPCVNCGHKVTKSIAWLKANTQFVCAQCGKMITLQSEELLGGIKKAEQVIDEFARDITKIGSE